MKQQNADMLGAFTGMNEQMPANPMPSLDPGGLPRQPTGTASFIAKQPAALSAAVVAALAGTSSKAVAASTSPVGASSCPDSPKWAISRQSSMAELDLTPPPSPTPKLALPHLPRPGSSRRWSLGAVSPLSPSPNPTPFGTAGPAAAAVASASWQLEAPAEGDGGLQPCGWSDFPGTDDTSLARSADQTYQPGARHVAGAAVPQLLQPLSPGVLRQMSRLALTSTAGGSFTAGAASRRDHGSASQLGGQRAASQSNLQAFIALAGGATATTANVSSPSSGRPHLAVPLPLATAHTGSPVRTGTSPRTPPPAWAASQSSAPLPISTSPAPHASLAWPSLSLAAEAGVPGSSLCPAASNYSTTNSTPTSPTAQHQGPGSQGLGGPDSAATDLTPAPAAGTSTAPKARAQRAQRLLDALQAMNVHLDAHNTTQAAAGGTSGTAAAGLSRHRSSQLPDGHQIGGPSGSSTRLARAGSESIVSFAAQIGKGEGAVSGDSVPPRRRGPASSFSARLEALKTALGPAGNAAAMTAGGTLPSGLHSASSDVGGASGGTTGWRAAMRKNPVFEDLAGRKG